MGGKGDLLGILQEIKGWHANRLCMHKLESVLENETHKIHWNAEMKQITQSRWEHRT